MTSLLLPFNFPSFKYPSRFSVDLLPGHLHVSTHNPPSRPLLKPTTNYRQLIVTVKTPPHSRNITIFTVIQNSRFKIQEVSRTVVGACIRGYSGRESGVGQAAASTQNPLSGMKGMKGMGKISAEYKVQGAEKETVQCPNSNALSIVALSNRLSSFSDTPTLPYPHTSSFHPLYPLHPC